MIIYNVSTTAQVSARGMKSSLSATKQLPVRFYNDDPLQNY